MRYQIRFAGPGAPTGTVQVSLRTSDPDKPLLVKVAAGDLVDTDDAATASALESLGSRRLTDARLLTTKSAVVLDSIVPDEVPDPSPVLLMPADVPETK